MTDKLKLNNVVKYSNSRINIKNISINNYISTDNLLQNKQGVEIAVNLPPNTENIPSYEANNILVSNIRPYLKKIWFSNKAGGCSSDILVFKVQDNYIPKFIYYCLFQDTFFDHMMQGSKGTRMPRGDKNQILQFLIPNFDLEKQQKIAHVLSVIDEKIENGDRQNKVLENLAKTIYDYWFVQFDFPDENGKPYKSSGGKMVYNSELKREIPLGWEVNNIEKYCQIVDCLHSKKPDLNFEDEKYFLLQLDNIKDDGLLDLTNRYYVTKSEYKKWTSRIEVTENDILITNAGRVAATAQIPKGVLSGIGRNMTAIRSLSISPTYLFLSFRSVDLNRQIKINTDSGAFFTSLNVKGIKKLLLVKPPTKIENDFEKIVYPIRKKRELISLENQKLKELRDWLLPMLMNGQIKVE